MPTLGIIIFVSIAAVAVVFMIEAVIKSKQKKG
jgi:hypothetical protein